MRDFMRKISFKDLRKLGFTQRKPTEPGVYLIANDETYLKAEGYSPTRVLNGWEVASIYFQGSNFSRAYDAGSSDGCWYIETLGGLNHGWRKGTWLKGPITPWNTQIGNAKP